MNASSQKPQDPGALPPLTPVPHPLQAAVTGRVLAEASESAPEAPAAAPLPGVRTYDSATMDRIMDAARNQAETEVRTELSETRELRTECAWWQERIRAVTQLTIGRPGHHHLPVTDILAALDGKAPDRARLTMRLSWDGAVLTPDGDRPGETTRIGCITALGGHAVLELEDAERLDLGDHLAANLHTAEACTTPGCGRSDAEFAQLRRNVEQGWIFVEVAGAEDSPRWWCRPQCAFAAMTAAGAELAAADQAAAVDPDQQASTAPVPDAVEDQADDTEGGDR